MIRNWKSRASIAVLAAATMLGTAGIAAAENCDRGGRYDSRYDRGNRDSRYRDRGAYRNNGNYGYGNSGYGYGNSGYGYGNSGYNSNYNDGYYNGNYGYGDYREPRSAGKSAAIIGGSAAVGAVVGGLTGGKKGAIIGGVVGGAGGAIYDRTTRNNQNRW